jgi:hypothetical protein
MTLRALDTVHTGASRREIAAALWGDDAVSRDWNKVGCLGSNIAVQFADRVPMVWPGKPLTATFSEITPD